MGREKIREYAAATGETSPVCLDVEAARAAGYADVVAPPMFVVVYSAPALGPAILDPDVGINFATMVHGGQEFVWGPPVVAGDEITTTASVKEICGARRDGLLRLRVGLPEPGRRDRLHRDLDQHRARGVMQPGDQLEELHVTPDKYLTVRYAGASGDFNPIHIDEEFAKAVGLPGKILHGLWTMAQVARAQTEAGGGPESLKRLSVQFRGMGLPEQELVVRSTVRAVERRRGADRHRGRAGGQADHPQRRGRGRDRPLLESGGR